jgi:hypothetical protein
MDQKVYSQTTKIPEFNEQEIKGIENLEEEELEPSYLTRLYTNNYFQRALAHLYGFYEGKWRRVVVDANGNLLTRSVETAIQKYDVINITAGDTESVAQLFSFPSGITVTRLVEVYTKTNPVLIRFIPYDETVLEQRELPANSFYSVDASIIGFKVQNAIAGSNAVVQVTGWY